MAYDSTLVVYTGTPLSYINVTPGMNLQTILQNINSAVNTLNPVPNYASFNYGPYYGYTLTTPTGSAITTITGFVTGTANGIGKVSSDLSTFIGTTYAGDQTILSNAITALQVPGLAYSHNAGGLSIAIVNTDTQLQIFTKLANAIGATGDLLAAPGSTWSTLSISTPTNINAAFNSLISYLSSLTTTVNGKQAATGTFNNSANCLTSIGGTSTDSLTQTINLIRTYICSHTLSFNAGTINTTCQSSQSNLQDWIQQLVNVADDYTTNYIAADGVSITDSGTSGACSGRTFSINSNWSGLGVVKASVIDGSPSDLESKLVAGTNVSISTINSGTQIQIDVATPSTTNKVAINSSDTNPGYLSSKISGALNNWGIGIDVSVDNDNVLVLTPSINSPFTFIQTIFNYISTDPTILAQFCTLTSQCSIPTCAVPTNFVVVLSDSGLGVFTLTWTPSGSAISQNVKYRLQGDTLWITAANIFAPNPQGPAITTADIKPGCTNIIIEFQVDSNCTSGSNGTSILHGIWYAQETLSANVTNGVITVIQTTMPTVDTIEYVLYSGSTPLQTVLATGSNPIGTFSAVSPGNYTIQYRYSTSIDGTIVSSDDPSQHAAYYVTGTITV
jgi:hypothetical protein